VAETYRPFWVIVCIAAIVNLFYIAPGRTGMFIFCCLVLLFLIQRLSLTRLALALVIFAVLLGVAYQTSDNFSGRVNEAYSEIINYQPGQSKTSVGQRFDWWHISIRLIREKPILGHGTGSYAGAHERLSRGTEITPTDNPHNEYLFLTVQFGLVGLSLFLLMIVLQLLEAKKTEKRDRQLLQGVILALLAGSLMNSLLFDSQQGHFYLFMSGALLAGNDDT
jgi:O-antigen ligase